MISDINKSEHEYIYEVKNIYKNYSLSKDSSTQVLKGVSLNIKKGSTISIQGPSGSGKSTLLNLLGTLDSPSSGEIFLYEKNISLLNDLESAEIRKSKIGFILQMYHLLPQLTVLENVILPALSLKQIIDDDTIKRAKLLLERLDLTERIDNLTSTLSGGEKLRTAIARSLINKPEILLADEPTGSLDYENAVKSGELLKELSASEQFTLITVTHWETLSNLMDEKYQLRNGILNKIM